MLAYYRAHPEVVPVREVVGEHGVLACSVHFHTWYRHTSPWNSLPNAQILDEQITRLSFGDVALEAQFETAMAAAFQLLFD